jgi:hypothetical protein
VRLAANTGSIQLPDDEAAQRELLAQMFLCLPREHGFDHGTLRRFGEWSSPEIAALLNE